METALRSIKFENNASCNAVKERMINSLGERFAFVKSSPVIIYGAIINPKTKLSFTKTDNIIFNFKEEDVVKIAKLFLENNLESEEVIYCPEESEKPKRSLFDFAKTEIPNSTNTAEESWSQMLSFLYTPLSSISPEKHWSMSAQSPFTILIQKVLAALPSTASVERLFSVAGNVQNPRRTRISAKRFQNSMLLKYNSET